MGRYDICALKQRPPEIPASLLHGATIYANRYAGLEAVAPKANGRIVEVGTQEGYLAAWMKTHLNPSELVIMDVANNAVINCEIAKNRTKQARAIRTTCLLGDSNQLLRTLPDDYFDIIYVDGGHDYRTVCFDLEEARQKVRPGGYLVVNDYFLFESEFLAGGEDFDRGNVRFGVYGVIHAVNEFAVRYRWPLAYLAMHKLNFPDVALRRPNQQEEREKERLRRKKKKLEKLVKRQAAQANPTSGSKTREKRT